MFRIVRHLESLGHKCRLYYYDPQNHFTVESLRGVLKNSFKPMKAELNDVADGMEPCDVVFATSWETAYPVLNFKTAAKKFYFVQDFEPYFFPVGSQYMLAENTYHFGFHGITAGGWLADKLSREYGMKCDSFYFGSDASIYCLQNRDRRKKVLFYAQPVKPRRGFELGILALQLFSQKHPEFDIEMVGWPLDDYKLPFKYTDHGILGHDQLNELYNKCAVALVVSLTNMSLLPLELISAGCIPVVNDGPNNRLVSDNPYVQYAQPSPQALAKAMSEVVERSDLAKYASTASQSVQALNWDDAGDRVAAALTRELNG